jgi:4-nitrophenyl phosphatase
MLASLVDALSPPRAYVIDKDGTLVDGGVPLPGAAAFLARLTRERVPFVVLSNTGVATGARVAEELTAALGVAVAPQCVHTAKDQLDAALAEAEAEAEAEVVRAGEGADAEAPAWPADEGEGKKATRHVAVYSDGGVADLAAVASRVAEWVAGGATLWLTSADGAVMHEAEDGRRRRRLGPGGLLAAVEAVLGERVPAGRLRVVGKGGTRDAELAEEAMRRLRAQGFAGEAGDVMIVGDRMDTDVRIGSANGWRTCLVESGCHRADLHAPLFFPADVVAGSVADLADGRADLAPSASEAALGLARRLAMRAYPPLARATPMLLLRRASATPRRIRSFPDVRSAAEEGGA